MMDDWINDKSKERDNRNLNERNRDDPQDPGNANLEKLKNARLTGWKDASPAICALILLLAVELAKNSGRTVPDEGVINTCLLFIGVLGFLFFGLRGRNETAGKAIRFFSNAMVVAAAYILNIDVYGNKIQSRSDLHTLWHILWLGWFLLLALSLVFHKVYKYICDTAWNALKYLVEGVSAVSAWLKKTVKSGHQMSIFLITTSMLISSLITVMEYIRGRRSLEACLRIWLLCWLACLIACMLGLLFYLARPKVKEAVSGIDARKILKYCVAMTVFVLVVSLSIFDILPCIFEIIGSILSCLLIAVLLIISAIYAIKAVCRRFGKMKANLQDICFLIVMVVFVTVVLIPCVGASARGETGISIPENLKYLKDFMDLFLAGLEIFQKLGL